jgi:hypothetical protein
MQALESLRTLIRASTTSMTSVPKPLKFLRPHFDTLKEVFEKIVEVQTKQFCADVISVLAMTMSETRESLKYRLVGTEKQIGEWGHEYVRYDSSTAPFPIYNFDSADIWLVKLLPSGQMRARKLVRNCWYWSTRSSPTTWPTMLKQRHATC